MEDRLLYRIPEVALILNISRSKVYELFSSGDFHSVKIDRARLVRGSDLRALTSHDLRSDLFGNLCLCEIGVPTSAVNIN